MLQLQPKLKQWQQKNFQLIIVSSDPADDLRAFFAEHNMPVKILLDPQGKVFEQYQVQYIPSDFLINTKGGTDSSFVGWDDSRSIEMENWVLK